LPKIGSEAFSAALGGKKAGGSALANNLRSVRATLWDWEMNMPSALPRMTENRADLGRDVLGIPGGCLGPMCRHYYKSVLKSTHTMAGQATRMNSSGKQSHTTPFLALLLSLPTGNATLRMRVWRTLKNTGCGVLRDGVYLLPVDAPRAAALIEAESEVKAAGGFAMTVELNFKTSQQFEHARKLFDRSNEYGMLVERVDAAKAGLSRLGKRKADTLVERLRRALADLTAIDFFPGQANLQAADAVAALEREAQRLFSAGEPHASQRKVRRLDPAKYRGRTWATRKNLWVDRLASAWLIKRFIDKNARFVWIERPRDRPKGAVGFDYDGAEFTHVASRVTFEVLVASFGLAGDPALASIGSAVHFLDAGGIPVADAKGLETILSGIKAKARSDDEAVLEANKIFDFFHSAYTNKEAAS
jgi:hypothetical protein